MFYVSTGLNTTQTHFMSLSYIRVPLYPMSSFDFHVLCLYRPEYYTIKFYATFIHKSATLYQCLHLIFMFYVSTGLNTTQTHFMSLSYIRVPLYPMSSFDFHVLCLYRPEYYTIKFYATFIHKSATLYQCLHLIFMFYVSTGLNITQSHFMPLSYIRVPLYTNVFI